LRLSTLVTIVIVLRSSPRRTVSKVPSDNSAPTHKTKRGITATAFVCSYPPPKQLPLRHVSNNRTGRNTCRVERQWKISW